MAEPAPTQSRLNLVVFKDNLVARAFRLPLSWIFGAEVGLSLLILAIFLTGFLAIRYYRIAAGSDVSLFADMERQIESLHRQLDEAKSEKPKSETPPPATSQATTPPAVTIFDAFAPGIRPIPPGTSVPIKLQDVRMRFGRGLLTVDYALAYTAEDGKNQQGRIILIARGPGYLLAHPAALLENPAKTTLFDPNEGEFFSVSRYRQGEAKFTLPAGVAARPKVELLIFDSDRRLMIRETLHAPEGEKNGNQ
jgi:hypothetical protein